MLLLLEVMLFYAVLAFLAIVAVWWRIGRTGFVGLQQADSRLACLFLRRRVDLRLTTADQLPTTNVTVLTLSPVFSTTAVLVLVVGQFLSVTGPRARIGSHAGTSSTPFHVTTDANL